MILSYFILLLLALFFKMMHFPFNMWLFLAGPILIAIFGIVALVKKQSTKLIQISILLCIALSIAFKFLYLPGALLFLLLGIFLLIFFGVRQRAIFQKGFATALILLLFFSSYNHLIQPSTFRLTYMMEDPFDVKQPIPPYFIQLLAFDFYQEKQFEKAEWLLDRNLSYYKGEITFPGYALESPESLAKNLKICEEAKSAVLSKNWQRPTPLEHE